MSDFQDRCDALKERIEVIERWLSVIQEMRETREDGNE